MAKQLTFQVTWKCDIRCTHCFQSHKSPTIDVAEANRFMDVAVQRGFVDRLAFTGGEAFLRLEEVCSIAMHGKKRWGVPFGIVTNSNWAESPEMAIDAVERLSALGLDHLTVSFDHFHLRWVNKDKVRNVLNAAQRFGVQSSIYSVHRNSVDRSVNSELVSDLEEEFSIKDYPRALVPVPGSDAERNASYSIPYHDHSHICPATETVASIWPDGSLLPCCSAGTNDKLSIGNIYEDHHDLLIDNLVNNSVMSQIKKHGLGVLHTGLSKENSNEVKNCEYASSCHICNKMLSLHNDETLHKVLRADLAASILNR